MTSHFNDAEIILKLFLVTRTRDPYRQAMFHELFCVDPPSDPDVLVLLESLRSDQKGWPL